MLIFQMKKKNEYHDIREKLYVKPRPRNRSRPRILRPQNKMKTWADLFKAGLR